MSDEQKTAEMEAFAPRRLALLCVNHFSEQAQRMSWKAIIANGFMGLIAAIVYNADQAGGPK